MSEQGDLVIQTRLNVPSGVIVYAEELNGFMVHDRYTSEQKSTDENLKLHSRNMENIGGMRLHVRQSWSAIFAADDGFEIAELLYDDETDEIIPHEKECIGLISDDDVFFYSFACKDEYLRRNDSLEGVQELVVRPGVYEFTHYVDALDANQDTRRVFARCAWVRDPEPVRDFRAEYMAINYSAEQVITYLTRLWPVSYRKKYGIQMAAATLLRSSDKRWHPNGFCHYDVNMPTEETNLVIPKFDDQFY